MPPVPVLRPREVVAAFRKLGWEVARQRGSHIILTKPGHPATLSVPDHPQVASAEFPVFGNSAVFRHIPKKKPQTSRGTKSALPWHPKRDTYSYLNATIGSTFAARRAGM